MACLAGGRALADKPVPVAPGSQPGDYVHLSPAERLGLQFDPLAAVPAKTDVPAPPPGTLRMPSFIVRDKKDQLTDHDVLTEKGQLELDRRRYISPLYQVTFGPLSQLAAYLQNPLSLFGGWHPSDAEATALARQDRRLERLSTLDDLISLESLGDPKVKAEMQSIRVSATTGTR